MMTNKVREFECGMRLRWVFRDGAGGFQRTAFTGAELPKPTKYSALIARLLAARGMLADGGTAETNLEAQIQARLDSSLHDLHDASLLPGADAAAARLQTAVQNGERVIIYGDYDVDGITASAILYHALKCAKDDAEVHCYVPHRLEEGYGLNSQALTQLKAEGAELVISVDCGISAVAAAAHAKAIGLELIITDHHNLPEKGAGEGWGNGGLPDVPILVHPRLPGSEYPWGELCGAGVAFKVAWRFATLWCGSERVSESFRILLTQLLTFAALGTIADVVPLQDENRTLARAGLKMMRHTDFVGLNALINAAGLANEKTIDSEAVGFRLGPRLNAAGRMGHAGAAVRMFTEASAAEAAEIAQDLNTQNTDRQLVERRILEQAVAQAEEAGMTGLDRRIIILANEEWHPGVVGIVCARLVERFGRPTILLHRAADLLKGSGRSIEGYSIYDGLSTMTELFKTWGGHDMAAGLSLEPRYYGEFVERLTAHANAAIAESDLVGNLKVDCAAQLAEFDLRTVQNLQELGPFGRMNTVPTFLVRGLRIQSPPKEMGSEGKHLSLQVLDPNPEGGVAGRMRLFRLVGWSLGHLAAELAAGQLIDVILRPKINRWRGQENVEAEIRDLRLCN